MEVGLGLLNGDDVDVGFVWDRAASNGEVVDGCDCEINGDI